MLVQIACSCWMQATYGGHHEIFSYMSASWNSTRGNPRVALWDRMALWSISIKKGYRFGTGEPLKKKEQFHIQWDKGLPYNAQVSRLFAQLLARTCYINYIICISRCCKVWAFGTSLSSLYMAFHIFFKKAIFSTTKLHAWHEEVFIGFNPFAHLSRPPWTFLAAKHRRCYGSEPFSPATSDAHKNGVPPEKKGTTSNRKKTWWPLKMLKKQLVYIINIYIYLFQMVPYKEDLDFGLDILVYIPEV